MLMGYIAKPRSIDSATDAVGEKAIACKEFPNKALPMKYPGTINVKRPQNNAVIKDIHMSTVYPFGDVERNIVNGLR